MAIVSVIVPVYNAERYLEQCICSLLMQTVGDIEILLINDGSTDKSGTICEAYSQKDVRIQYDSISNQGPGPARNLGMEHATGEWLCFVDGDDYLPWDALENLLMAAQDADIVIGSFFRDVNGKLLPEKIKKGRKAASESSLYMRIGSILECYNCRGAGDIFNLAPPWGKLYKRSFCLENRLTFPEVMRAEDVIFNIRANQLTERIAFVDSKVYCYRIHDASICHRYQPDFEDTAGRFLSCLHNVLTLDTDRDFSYFYEFEKLRFLIANMDLTYAHPACPMSLREKTDGIRRLCESYQLKTALVKIDVRLLSPRQRLLLWLLSRDQFSLALHLLQLKRVLAHFTII